MKGIIVATVTLLSITSGFGSEIISLNEFTREDEVYIQRGWSEMQGTCALMAIHEVFDYGMEDEYELRINSDIAVMRSYDNTGYICTVNEMITVHENVQVETMKHEDMCYSDNSC